MVLPGSGSRSKTPLSANSQAPSSEAVKKPQKVSASGGLAQEVLGAPSMVQSILASDWTFSTSKPADSRASPASSGSPSAHLVVVESPCWTTTVTPSDSEHPAAWAGEATASPPVAMSAVSPRRAMVVRMSVTSRVLRDRVTRTLRASGSTRGPRRVC